MTDHELGCAILSFTSEDLHEVIAIV